MNDLKNCSETRSAGLSRSISLPQSLAVLLIASSVVLYSCGPSREEMEYKENASKIADSVSEYVSPIATDTINGITHNFIRTADLKLKVKDVLKTTEAIEDIVKQKGGYVSVNDLNSEIESQASVKFTEDSLKEIKRYITNNHLTIRVPNKQLDTVLRSITGMATFIDFSRLQSDDVKMKLYANKLAENRYNKFGRRIEQKSNSNTHKLSQNVNAEEQALEKQMLADEKSVQSFDMADQVNYSTVRLVLYQHALTVYETTPIPQVIEPYEPSYIQKLGLGFMKGFGLIKTFFLFLVESWGLILIIVALFFTTKKVMQHYNRKPI
ncbi:MAG: DUF4349 domain-containing protein [Bacteroidia bacterium]|nr:DUF4349 domain-containing protein [Bacteroidia bacterium]